MTIGRIAAFGLLIFAGCSEYDLAKQPEDTTEPGAPSTETEVVPSPEAPAIQLDPEMIDFGPVAANTSVDAPFTITNVGGASLEIGQLRVDGGPAFQVEAVADFTSLDPGQSVDVRVTFTPDVDTHEGRVLVPNTDPTHTEAVVDLFGELGQPLLEVTPLLVDFGYVEVGADAVATVEIKNIGNVPGDVTSADTVDLGFAVQPVFVPATLAPGQTTTVDVHFQPLQPLDYVGDLTVTMTDATDVVVDLIGTGIAPPEAVCDATPLYAAIGVDAVTWIGSGSSDPASRPLQYDWQLVTAPAGSVAPWPLGTPTSPDRSGFYPDVPGTYTGELTVTNDVGLSDTCTVDITADDATPVAICDVTPNPIEAIYGAATWVGSSSYDPLGGPLQYAWTLVSRPAGSAAVMPGGSATQSDRPNFVADNVGAYTAELVVTNSVGIPSAPCQVTLQAIPAAELWVEMYWAQSGDDMDLHVVRSTGSLRTTQDCYYSNCRGGLDWGPVGPDANPVLDIDDISGTGPENINVVSPENVVYHVWVHDYPGSSYTGSNDVTVNIYLSGSLAWTNTVAISGENSDVWFADVDWATMTVVP